MAHICIITPGQLATNPRVVKEAECLEAAGHQVSVVTGRFMPWAVEGDRAFEGRSWGRPLQAPFGPLAPTPVRMRQKLVRTVAEGLARLGFGGAANLAIHDAAADLRRTARTIPADLFIAHYDAALPAAAAAARRHKGAYAFDAEDFHPGDLPDTAPNGFTNRLIANVEAGALPGCAYISAASPGIAAAYAAQYGLPEPTVILNAFSKTEAPDGPSLRGRQAAPSLYWFSQTIGPDRGLEAAVRAVALAQSRPHVFLRGNISRAYEAELRRLAGQNGVADRMHLLPTIAPDALIADMAGFDVSFIGETGHTRNRRVALVNKLFSSFIAGVPVVASDIPAHRDLVADCKAALRLYAVDDAQALADQMDSLLLNPTALIEARAEAWRLGQERFNWEIERVKLLALVEGALAGRAAPQQRPQ